MTHSRWTQNSPQKHLRIRHYLAAVVAASVLAAVLVGWQWARYADWGPRMTQLVVRGDFKRVDPARVRTAIKPYLGGGYFRVDVDVIRTAVVALPWVESATVDLDWPSTIRVHIQAQHAVALWNGNSLINATGVAFVHSVPLKLKNLPKLSGPTGSAAQVLKRWHRMTQRLAQDSLKLASLRLYARGAWRATLVNGLELHLGSQHPSENLQRFIAVVPRVLGRRLADAAYIDLRYTNGFAVGWKSDSESEGKGHA